MNGTAGAVHVPARLIWTPRKSKVSRCSNRCPSYEV